MRVSIWSKTYSKEENLDRKKNKDTMAGNGISAPVNFLKYYTLEREELTDIFICFFHPVAENSRSPTTDTWGGGGAVCKLKNL